jgi:PIN domain nuclease of toxin-antitoxin system
VSLYVTDTHPLLWYATKNYNKLSPAALRAFRKASRGEVLIWVPALSLWEIGLLERIRRIRLQPSFPQWTAALSAEPGFAIAPLDFDVVDSALSIRLSLDIFDIGILATAKSKGLPLITKDAVITDSKVVDVLW